MFLFCQHWKEVIDFFSSHKAFFFCRMLMWIHGKKPHKTLDINLEYIKHIYIQKTSSINIITLHFFNEKAASVKKPMVKRNNLSYLRLKEYRYIFFLYS